MKICMPLIFAAGLLVVPAHAYDRPNDDVFSEIFGGGLSDQPHNYNEYYQRGHRGFRHRARYAAPAEYGGSFTAMTSWYGGGPKRFEPNTHTASGERFNAWGLTAAHRSLPIGTRLMLSHGGRSVVVRVNDRGPAAWTGRSLDVSKGAAARLGLLKSGTGAVHVTVL